MNFNQKKEEILALEFINSFDYDSARRIYNGFIKKNIANNLHYTNLAFIYAKNNDWDKVIQYCKKAIELDNKAYNAWSILGLAYKYKSDYSKAVSAYENSIKIKPDFFDAYCNLGLVRHISGDFINAKTAYSKALELNPNSFQLFYNIGNLFYDQSDFKNAALNYEKSIKINDNSSLTYLNLALTFRKLNKLDYTISNLNKAFELDNSNPLIRKALIMSECQICDWTNYDIRIKWLNQLGIIGTAISPMGVISMEDSPERQFIRAKRYFESNFKKKKLSIKVNRHKLIRIGYFSGNFYEHAVSHLLVRTLELHNKEKFEIFAYSFSKEKYDKYTERIISASDHYRDVNNLNDLEVAKLVASDEIDIAVDLMGYSDSNRHGIFAYKPSPIQISYLGYPCTTGSAVIDYIIADKYLIPNEQKRYYSEKVIYMPNTYQCNDDTISVSRRVFNYKDIGIKNASFVFCCFNTNYKIGPKEFDSWMRILSNYDNSVLWLIKSNDLVKQNLYKESELRGIDSSRIIFSDPIKLNEHMARQKLANLALDTFNYNSGATAWIYLRAGLPLLTLSGRSYASRMATSILLSLELKYLVANNIEEYEYKAIELAEKPNILKELKEKLNYQIKNSEFFNSSIFTRNLEDKYYQLYHNMFKNI